MKLYVLEQEVSCAILIQDLHPVDCTLGDVDKSHAWSALTHYQRVDTDIVRPDP